MGRISRQHHRTYQETTKRTDQLFTVVCGRRMSNDEYERFRLQVRKTLSLGGQSSGGAVPHRSYATSAIHNIYYNEL